MPASAHKWGFWMLAATCPRLNWTKPGIGDGHRGLRGAPNPDKVENAAALARARDRDAAAR